MSLFRLGFSPVRIKNVTTYEPVPDGCCYYNVTVTWQVAAFNESHVPSFKISLSSDKKKIRNAVSVTTEFQNGLDFTTAKYFAQNCVENIDGCS